MPPHRPQFVGRRLARKFEAVALFLFGRVLGAGCDKSPPVCPYKRYKCVRVVSVDRTGRAIAPLAKSGWIKVIRFTDAQEDREVGDNARFSREFANIGSQHGTACSGRNSVDLKGDKVSGAIGDQCFTMSRKKVWNSIMRRKKKNHLDLSGREESDSGSVSPLLRRVSTLPRSGMELRHTMGPEMSKLCVYTHDPSHFFMEKLHLSSVNNIQSQKQRGS
nr:uncharacterized protein LOC116428870 [Nomia melanderi]